VRVRGQRGRIARRTAADVGLTLAVIVLSVVWMQGLGVLLGPDYAGLIGYFSPQTQIVPILIVGLGVDFAIHLLARYRSEVGGGAAPEQAWATSARTVGLTLLLCTAATAIGFLTNLVSPVEFLATLGVLAAAGIVAAFVLTLTVVPAVRVLLDRRAQRRGVLPVEALGTQNERALPRVIGRTAVLAERVPVPTLVVALLLAGVGGYGFTQLDSEFELTDFVPQDEPLLATFEAIDRQFNGGFDETTALLLTGELATPDGHDATIASIERAGEIDDVATVGDRPDGTTLASVLVQALADESLAGELAELGVRDDLRVEDDADVAALYALLLEEVPAAREVLAPTDDGGYVGRVELRTTAGQSRAAELEASLLEAFAPVDEAGGEAVATSPEIVQADIGERIEDSQLISLLTALGAAMALLVLHFTLASRRPLLGVITVLPVGLVLALTFGTMALTGGAAEPGHRHARRPVDRHRRALHDPRHLAVPRGARARGRRAAPHRDQHRRGAGRLGADHRHRLRGADHLDAGALRAARLRDRVRDRLLARRRGAGPAEPAGAVGPLGPPPRARRRSLSASPGDRRTADAAPSRNRGGAR
jgi:uncharacterized protein